ncbi:MAG: hypothetical protein FD177_240 [Desulfovibrionaceae bacterium]|nr:MAG: hypothetical protein FD177_240 [Desulfovibrionaceae bacterium]
MADHKLEPYVAHDFGNQSFAFRAAYLLAYKLAESGCPGSTGPAQHVIGLFREAHAEFKKLNTQPE